MRRQGASFDRPRARRRGQDAAQTVDGGLGGQPAGPFAASLLDEVLALGVSLRQAQAGLQGDELRALTKQRRQLIAAVTTEVKSLASSAGVKLTEPVARQVEDTLAAAMVDETAAAAVHSGMLTDALASTGVGSLALGSVVGVIPGKLHAVPRSCG